VSRRGGTVRGIFAGFLGLVALHAVGTKGGSGRVASAFADVAGLIERVLDADVPAIPDRRAGAADTGPGSKAAVDKAKAAGGAQGTTSDRFAGRLPLPDPPK
jgi:hypothetical protein